jgi:hypothetical protein
VRFFPWLAAAAVLGNASCLAVAGLDGDYSAGEVGAAGAGVGTGGDTNSTPSGGGSGATGGNGGSGATGGSGGSGASGGGGGSTPVEDCLDGIDNDDDDLIDCADSACEPDYECVPLPPVPTDWQGYFIVDSTTYPASSTQPCVDASQPQVLFGGPAGAAQCAACACGDPAGASCTYPTMSRWKNQTDCAGLADDLFAPGNDSCYQFPTNCGESCDNDQRLRLVTQSALSGNPTCAPMGGTPTVSPLWTHEHHVCALSASGGGGCDSGQACASTGTSFGGACVRRDGIHGCPSGFPIPLTTYNDASDDRGCSTCSCAAGSVTCSGGAFTVYGDTTCQGGSDPELTVSGTTCESARSQLDQWGGSYRAVAGTMSGTCAAQGGQPTGSVAPSGAVTFCCI